MIRLLLASLLAAATPSPAPPPLLAQALARHGELRLLEAKDLRAGTYTVVELARFGYWPPWVSADLDADNRADVAAVVAVQSGTETGYGVVAIHARSAKKLQWVEPPQRGPLFGVALGPGKDTLIPLHCVECDSNAWYRWSGKDYAVFLFRAGDEVAIAGGDKANPPRLFTKASEDARVAGDIRPCARARILRLRRTGRPPAHWYEVELAPPARGRGWIQARRASLDCAWTP